jgi:glycosyltransferase involved in cell wall biosynthesis
MGRAAVLLQTSNYEGMSVAVMEALAAGCAIVSTRVSGVEDMEQEPAASAVVKLYNIGDTAQAAQYLRALLQEASPAIAGQARDVARQFFSIDQCVQQYLQFSNALAPAAQALAWQARPAQALWSRLLATLRYIKYKLRN